MPSPFELQRLPIDQLSLEETGQFETQEEKSRILGILLKAMGLTNSHNQVLVRVGDTSNDGTKSVDIGPNANGYLLRIMMQNPKSYCSLTWQPRKEADRIKNILPQLQNPDSNAVLSALSTQGIINPRIEIPITITDGNIEVVRLVIAPHLRNHVPVGGLEFIPGNQRADFGRLAFLS